MRTTTRKTPMGDEERWSHHLAENRTLRWPGGLSPRLVRVERGRVVVTLEGDGNDYVLDGGEEMVLPGGGLAVAWALQPSLVVGERFRTPHAFHLGPPAGAAAHP